MNAEPCDEEEEELISPHHHRDFGPREKGFIKALPSKKRHDEEAREAASQRPPVHQSQSNLQHAGLYR